MSDLENLLRIRANDQCELCSGDMLLEPWPVPPNHDDNVDTNILVCDVCRGQLEADAELDGKHWFCLQTAMWSEVAGVQVVALRMLRKLSGEAWAQDLLDQAYFSDEVTEWAEAGEGKPADRALPKAFDSNGAELADGDSVTLIKDLDVKGTSFVAKRGTLVRGIRLTENPEHVEGKVNKVAIVLKTCFLKKA